jgi:hypothetical protein
MKSKQAGFSIARCLRGCCWPEFVLADLTLVNAKDSEGIETRNALDHMRLELRERGIQKQISSAQLSLIQHVRSFRRRERKKKVLFCIIQATEQKPAS